MSRVGVVRMKSRNAIKGRSSLHSGEVVHQTGAYPGFCSMKRLRVFPLPPGWDASPSQGYPPALSSPVPIYTPVRGTARVKCLAQEHNTMSLARVPTRTARSRVKRTNHEATKNPTMQLTTALITFFTSVKYILIVNRDLTVFNLRQTFNYKIQSRKASTA